MLYGSGLLLLHQDGLWRALDLWLRELSAETFVALLPILRRAFSGFQDAERRAMGEKVQKLHATTHTGSIGSDATTSLLENINAERANQVLPVLAHILGVTYDGNR